jgi:hypothetical protein
VISPEPLKRIVTRTNIHQEFDMPASAKQHEWVSRVLGIKVGAVSKSETGAAEEEFGADLGDLGLDVSDLWHAARKAFDAATASVDAQISALQHELRISEDYELEAVAEFGLNGLTRNTRVPLLASLLEVGDGSKANLQSAAPKIAKAAQAFMSQLSSDARIAACDQNPFGIDVAIVATYQGAIVQLLDTVRAARRG